MQSIQGNPELVASEAAEMGLTAEMLAKSASLLVGLANGYDKSKAIDNLSTAMVELAAVLTSAYNRYEPAGSALAAYSPALRTAMIAVDVAIVADGNTDVGQSEKEELLARAHEAALVVNPFSSQHDLQQAADESHRAANKLHEERSAEQAAAQAYAQAMVDLHKAATAAAHQIETGIRDSHLDDGFDQYSKSIIKHLENILSKPLAIIHEILVTLATKLSLLAIACAFIPVIGDIAYGILDAISAGLNWADMGVETLRYEFGDITFGDYVTEMLLDVVGMFVGKAATKLIGKGAVEEIAEQVVNLSYGEDAKYAQDPVAGWVDSQTKGAPTLDRYLNSGTFKPIDFSGVDPDQIVEQSGIDVPGHIRVVAPLPTAPLQVAPPEQYPFQLTVRSSSVGV